MSRGSRGAPPGVTNWTRRLLKKGSTADEKGVGPLAHKGCEGRIDLAAGAGVEDLDLQPDGASRRFHVSQRGLGIAALAGLTSTAMRAAAGTSSRSSSSRFAANSSLRKLIAGQVAARPGEARDKTKPDRVVADEKTIGIVVVAALAANAECGRQPRRSRRPAANQFGRQRRQPIALILGPAVFDRHVLAFDIAGLLQALAKCAQTVRAIRARRCRCRETRSPASPAAARAPRAATPPPRRRAA